jgi:putative membrane protein insertion efficiency factor
MNGTPASGPARALIGAVRAYRLLLKAWIGGMCRFEPTCSAYAIQALEQHGALAGSALAAGRLLRCHPWCQGGLDPVPEHPPFRPFTSLLARVPRQDDTPSHPPAPERPLR